MRNEARERQIEMEAARRFGDLPSMHLEFAIKSLDALSGDPEEDHIEADIILLGFLKHMGYGSVVLAYLQAKERSGFWYA